MSQTATDAQRPPEPDIARSLTLHLRGDWGGANLHRVCGWIAQELGDRTGPHTRIATWNSRGFVDAVRAVGRGEVQVALATPSAFVCAALDGRGPYADEHYPDLRALGVVPQRDRLVIGVRKSLGIGSFEELRARRPALRLATSVDDGVNHVGVAALELLARSGVDIEGWGGELLLDERPFESLEHVAEGRADAIAHEAVMLPAWQEIGADLTFLEVEPEVLDGLRADFGWPDAVVEEGYFPGSPRFRTLDFSDFLVLARADLPEDVAYAIAWVLGETRHQIERQYRHIPPERSPITYPLDPVTMGRAPIPLHPGAARYYEALPGWEAAPAS
ncbi:TAXI family TRAP transporter solute-binding subunit [Streptomyces sp. DSM 44917]|uniref:TAXI family TRAP transporter solute-binding subunit n=1 Tax=Streptomyces boetiae TaxID=3075541 RepID=A0ABU2L823_9ACTN|nr:TAXI family TRAP transporter solute-binding subunit [Streptomyces sp. DSM 44917]MDT0307492.1 TAXI family TRAP transporter solute-binding subunit [Streptomyces sp. DSM 44917]